MLTFDFPAGKNSHILVADNALSKSMCNDFVAHSQKFIGTPVFRDGHTMGGSMPMIKNAFDCHFSKNHPDWAPARTDFTDAFEDTVLKALSDTVSYYRSRYRHLWPWMAVNDTGYLLQRYAEGQGYYREHTDAAPWIDDARHRVLAAVVYLNDVPMGGETEFTMHDVAIEPAVGRIALFPANFTHPHQANVPFGADKWIISSFLF